LVAFFLPQLKAQCQSGKQASPQAEEAGPAIALPAHPQHRHSSSSAVGKFKELKSQPSNPTQPKRRLD